MWTVSPDDRRRDMSSKAAVVFPVPVSPFNRRSRVFRSSNFCNSGGKGISGDAPRSSFNIRSPNWREEETWAAIYHRCVLRCVLLCSPEVNRAARSIRWRTEHKKSSDDGTFSEARRRGTRRLGPSAPRRTDSDLPCSFTSNATGVCPRGCTLCVLCHRTARGALQPRQEEMGRSDAPIPTEGNIPRQLGFDAQRETAGGFRYRETKCGLVCR